MSTWNLFHLSSSEFLLYSGLVVMAAAVILSVLCIIIFCITGRRIKRKLEQEYGKPRRQA